ncbi:accessory Sec system translocase SecA2 [Cytobacillus massiliigabonensis]|uniref:accessory Sec system translocase SecA2 n=1 Tax=Cytobacillus massiliigabonensis TaxID=1871011 RepID=UPI000C84595C|nr:accessory Sec system translocase SecA2 [Cytobacillus massiliigabonensis]
MLTYFKKVIGDEQQRRLKKYVKMVEKINALEAEFEKLTDDELREKSAAFRDQIEGGASVLDVRIEAFATVREASKRVLNMRHFDVQLIGGLVLSDGNISEMPTGEGKTLVASLPSYLYGLTGKGVHVITVNDYLAKRDREQIGQIHEFLGLKVGLNISGLSEAEKQEAYLADITYGVGTEFGFDHLRDKMVYNPSQRVQRPYHFAIIDEVDSVLIDEAKTPLIIAGKTNVSKEFHFLCSRIVKTFVEDVDYNFDRETKTTNLTEDGITKVERGFGIDNMYDLEHQTLYHYIIQALRARVMFQRDVDYIVKDNKIMLVDMFTGRIMEGRTLSNGLHQAIEAKEGVEVTEENKTQASITIQNYFRLYPKMSGMTGTAKTEESEFRELYGMDVIQIPTNRPIARKDLQDRVYLTTEQKYAAVTEEVKKVHATGQPILIGTTSIIQSEEVAKYLEKAGLTFEILNAKTVEQEIRLITQAGQKGQITIATNMAGRGTDIKLGDGVEELGGLYVLGTERHESRRIDNQLKGRSGRQGDPGRSQFFISIQDEMITRFASEDLEKMEGKFEADEHGEITGKKIHAFIDRVQRVCEHSNYSIREYNLKLDNIINEQRSVIYQLRDKVLLTDDVISIVEPMIMDYTKHIVKSYCVEDVVPEEWDISALAEEINRILPSQLVVFEEPAVSEYETVETAIFPVIKEYVDQVNELKENEELQFTLKTLVLGVIDNSWILHLEAMERLKEGIGLRSYSQEDPMRQYAREGLELFEMMYKKLERNACYHLGSMVAADNLRKENEGGNK